MLAAPRNSPRGERKKKLAGGERFDALMVGVWSEKGETRERQKTGRDINLRFVILGKDRARSQRRSLGTRGGKENNIDRTSIENEGITRADLMI